MAKFKNPALKKLTEQQVRYAPVNVRLQQVAKAERLLWDLDPQESYSYQELCERITAFKPDQYPALKIEGTEVIHDLGLFVEKVSDSTDQDADSVSEPVLTVEDVSARFNVSTKTVDRWRKKGLPSRRFRFNGRKRIGFLESTVEQFAKQHPGDVSRGSQFSQLTQEERELIVNRARRLAKAGGCPTEISKRLALRMNRSAETIRYTLRHFDEQHPEQAIFPDHKGPLTDERRAEIFDAYHNGTPVNELADQYCRSRTSVHRLITEERGRRLFEEPLDYMDSPEFHKKGCEKEIFGAAPEYDEQKKKTQKAPPGLPPYLASLYSVPLLNRAQEQYWFRKMNYLKFKAFTMREKMDPSSPRVRDMSKVEQLIEEANEIKNFLIRSNLRLVVSIAKKHIQPGRNFFEMVSDGNMSLIRAIEKFDYTQGNKFSTYASWAIMKNFARSIPQEYKVLDRYRTGLDEVFSFRQEQRGSEFAELRTNNEQRDALAGILDELEERERAILTHRYGLNRGSEPETLEQVGERFGVTKERIRQIEKRALSKARKYAEAEKIDIPGM